MARFMHIARFAMRAALYFEYVELTPIGRTRLAEKAQWQLGVLAQLRSDVCIVPQLLGLPCAALA